MKSNKLKKNSSHKKKTIKYKFKTYNCSPSKKYKFSCYNYDDLLYLKKMWNKFGNKKITSRSAKIIWNQLKKNLIGLCNNEKCWLSKLDNKNKYTQKKIASLFAPYSPDSWKKNPVEWLSSEDIKKIMKQYEEKFKNFKFIGPSPIDFDTKKNFSQCVWNELCNFDLKKYIQMGKNKIGIIFNLDPHYLGGSHWVCLFINLKENYIYYFDSNGEIIPKQIKILVERIQNQGKLLNLKLKYIENKREHQKTNTECGIYVLVVIILLLKNKRVPKDFNKRIDDKVMIKLRKILFNH